MANGVRETRGQKKYPKKCTLAIYHTGSILVVIGVVLAIVGMATSRLFHIYIYDHRKPAQFLNLHIAVGLFSTQAEVTMLSMEQRALPKRLELNDSRWTAAQILTSFGVIFAISSFLMHIMFSVRGKHRNWTSVIFEVFGLLIAVIAILIGLSLSEGEIEYIHDHGDQMLTNFLSANQLLGTTMEQDIPQVNFPVRQQHLEKNLEGNRGEFALLLTPPQLSFALLIASDFLLLIAFLTVLIHFVRLCEKAVQASKQLKTAKLTRA